MNRAKILLLGYSPCHRILSIEAVNTVVQRYKSLKRHLDFSKVPKLDEADLEEQNVAGWGPGGQSVNKTHNAIVLKHIPTNTVVKCHETRSMLENKKIARQLLIKKLDNLFNGEDSIENQERRILAKKSEEKKQRQEILNEKKRKFKEQLKKDVT